MNAFDLHKHTASTTVSSTASFRRCNGKDVRCPWHCIGGQLCAQLRVRTSWRSVELDFWITFPMKTIGHLSVIFSGFRLAGSSGTRLLCQRRWTSPSLFTIAFIGFWCPTLGVRPVSYQIIWKHRPPPHSAAILVPKRLFCSSIAIECKMLRQRLITTSGYDQALDLQGMQWASPRSRRVRPNSLRPPAMPVFPKPH